MSDLNPEKLNEIASKIQAVLDEFEIDSRGFALNIRVSREYYQMIKENFPKRHSIDMIVSEKGREWAIDLHYLP
jgi:hypothetical protein